jgi:hypothetical protein
VSKLFERRRRDIAVTHDGDAARLKSPAAYPLATKALKLV